MRWPAGGRLGVGAAEVERFLRLSEPFRPALAFLGQAALEAFLPPPIVGAGVHDHRPRVLSVESDGGFVATGVRSRSFGRGAAEGQPPIVDPDVLRTASRMTRSCSAKLAGRRVMNRVVSPIVVRLGSVTSAESAM